MCVCVRCLCYAQVIHPHNVYSHGPHFPDLNFILKKNHLFGAKSEQSDKMSGDSINEIRIYLFFFFSQVATSSSIADDIPWMFSCVSPFFNKCNAFFSFENDAISMSFDSLEKKYTEAQFSWQAHFNYSSNILWEVFFLLLPFLSSFRSKHRWRCASCR